MPINLSSIDRDPDEAAERAEFEAIYRRSFAHLALIAAGITGDRTHAEDIVQEAAIIALRKRHTLVPGSNVPAWMAGIVRRCALNYARKVRGRKTSPADPVLIDQSTEYRAASAEAMTVSEAAQLPDDQTLFDDDVLRALKSLNTEARCCLLLRIVEQLPYQEIAQLMDVPEGTAMSHVHRAKASLRGRLRPAATPRQTNVSPDA